MGRGGGGGGKRRTAGGGRRLMGGGGSAPTEDVGISNTEIAAGKFTPAQGEALQRLPPNDYRIINPDSSPRAGLVSENQTLNSDLKVEVGSKGAPVPNPSLYTEESAIQKLKDIGIPEPRILAIDGLDSARELASILPDDARFLGTGAEGMGINIGGGKVIRVQWDGETPMLQNWVGKNGVYSEWKTKAGNVYVEQKAKVKSAKEIMMDGEMTDPQLRAIRNRMEAELRDAFPGVLNDYERKMKGDVHFGNFGRDANGNWVVFDPGAIVRAGDKVLVSHGEKGVAAALKGAEKAKIRAGQ